MKIFITGIAGFLGSHLADEFLKDGHTVWGVDNLLGGYKDNVPVGAGFIEADCTHFGMMLNRMAGADVVYHTAATAYEGLSVFSPSLVSRNIVDASVTVFSAAIANKVKRIVHCSSMARYGEAIPPFRETTPTRPQDPYGIAKVAAEDMLKNLSQVHGIEYVIAVPHNIYGPRQKYDDPFRNVASIMMNLMLQGRNPIIYGDGQQQRCLSYITDCLWCLKEMATRDNVVGQTINIGPDEEPITINTLCREIASVTRFKGEPVYMPGRPQEVRVALCSSDKARRMLGYKTGVLLPEGLGLMCKWMQARGTRPFNYHLPIEIVSSKTPKTWTDRLF
jgi:UDP-glucose 4-epimerase